MILMDFPLHPLPRLILERQPYASRIMVSFTPAPSKHPDHGAMIMS